MECGELNLRIPSSAARRRVEGAIRFVDVIKVAAG